MKGRQLLHDSRNPGPIIVTVNGLQRRFIRRLDAHFQLDPPFRSLGQQFQVIIGEDARFNFKVEIDRLLHVDHVFDEGPVMTGIAVKRPVYEFHLMDTGCNELLQFGQDQRHGAEADRIAHSGQAVLAMKGTAPGTFIIDDFMGKLAEILSFIGKRQGIEISYFGKGFIAPYLSRHTSQNAGNVRAITAFVQSLQECRYNDFTFSLKDVINIGMISEDIPGGIRYFRTAYEDTDMGHNLTDECDDTAGHFYIPDITRKADDFCMELVNMAQNVIGIVIDRIFCRYHIRTSCMPAGSAQAAQGQG